LVVSFGFTHGLSLHWKTGPRVPARGRVTTPRGAGASVPYCSSQ
jgi:hypothetical protein